MFDPGRLRHRVDIERQVRAQDATTGVITTTWEAVYSNVPVAIEPMSVRGYYASRQAQSEVSVMIVLRYLPDLLPTMRLRAGTTIYNPDDFLPDKDSGLEYLTAPCSVGVNEGQ